VIYACCNLRRGEEVRKHATLNGIESLEVLDEDAPLGSPRQRTLLVRSYKAMAGLEAPNVRIEGGTRIRPVGVEWAYVADVIGTKGVLTPAENAFLAGLADPTRLLVVRTDTYGDFSTYTLRLVQGPGVEDPPPSFDPVLAAILFSFKAECPTPFDCRHVPACPPEARKAPLVNYLAKDYASFRRLMLDRLALLVPEWRERNPADLGVALVELLAYVGDSLSYRQDVVATEAYLETARRRTSVRRHARLVDYFMHDGANARAWVQVQAQGSPLIVPAKTQVLSKGGGLAGASVDQGSEEHRRAVAAGVAVFETMHRAVSYPVHNRLSFYTWGDTACVLYTGATRATLVDGAGLAPRVRLRAGDVLVFEEVRGPQTGRPSDADPTRRHAVRLTRVEPEATLVLTAGLETDRIPDPTPLEDPLTLQPIVKIEWGAEDALPFPLCISSPDTTTAVVDDVFTDVSIASGNVVLADHGRTLPEPELLGPVPEPGPEWVPASPLPYCEAPVPQRVRPRFRPTLREVPVTQVGHVLLRDGAGAVRRAAFDPQGSAASVFLWEARRALGAVELTAVSGGEAWRPERELLDSTAADRHFVVEVDDDGRGTLRFGDGEHGMGPASGTRFEARYRVGNGSAGNVGRESLAVLVRETAFGFSPPAALLSVRNPLPASGGTDAEPLEEVRQKAPYAFRTQERAVTLDDYAAAALRLPGLQNAAARFRWTGSWRTVFVTPDPVGGDTRATDPTLKTRLRDHLERFRMAGYDLEADDPRYVSLEIELHACVKPGYFPADVEQALLQVFSNRVLADGTKGLFHPDRFSFGETVYLSPLFEAAMAVDGVDSARFLVFRRQGRPDQGKALQEARLTLHRLEIARLDNDPNFPEHGTFRASVQGGP
jgi:hypothetical protein